ncbi:hypothetical protein VIBNISFn27_750034 [Vibrio nigripulchritudo SFn27]|uniref:Trimeric autotransporter adhesin YadA-like C-terminal membrane anchor domain-containing protein n=1 Tax=Vibrio nigripulchritudo TaxID=28173 RepID=U4KE60_9VIBR|nr:YadA C-terminal domain-containing protein [Vibrio nigripulchritudo]KJY78843.1 hypothetical protein TW74_12480 [Vibrio nigripulchritudo]CCN83061.1 hypothetical protein VIBNIBLFn1_550110 [Vibrio nigripulchritudo BLFn1]CCN90671.1 hypothetical protein VIBNISFn27_750034 [Vibrio nigripulchritudo SFn27]CCN97258.1 hypothetical protein VIBNIENn2_920034 [Vibrio nigripulchritudo ENn2]CCO39893.1 hypothetical protein VIBNISFn135_200034 [Vibrio nigripulchritudo SFn135]
MKKAILATALLSTFSMGSMAATAPELVKINDVVDYVTNEVRHDRMYVEAMTGTEKHAYMITDENGNSVIVTQDMAGNGFIVDVEGETYRTEMNSKGEISRITDSKGNEIDPQVIDDQPLPDADKAAIDATINTVNNNQKDIADIYRAGTHAGEAIAKAAADADARLTGLETQFEQMAQTQLQQSRRIDQNEGKMSNGIAGVAAMANIPTVTGKTTFGAGVARFNGSNAIAIGASTGFENGISLKGSLSYAKGKFEQKDVVVGAGIGYSF